MSAVLVHDMIKEGCSFLPASVVPVTGRRCCTVYDGGGELMGLPQVCTSQAVACSPFNPQISPHLDFTTLVSLPFFLLRKKLGTCNPRPACAS